MPRRMSNRSGLSALTAAGTIVACSMGPYACCRKASLSLRPGLSVRAAFHCPFARASRSACAVASALASSDGAVVCGGGAVAGLVGAAVVGGATVVVGAAVAGIVTTAVVGEAEGG